MKHLDDLNPAQKEAVLHTTGPLIIVAGAGTGKTRVLTRRMLHLITQGIAPESILAITFTNKAAGEMRERVGHLLSEHAGTDKPIYRTPFVGTFHSFGVSVLRDNAVALGLPARFSIFDRDDSISLIKRIQKDLGMDPKAMSASSILSTMSRSKGEAMTLARYREERSNERVGRTVTAVWERYAEELAKEKAFDFDDLLLATHEMLKSHPDILERYRRRFSHIMVDEYQDTNIVQYELAKLLANPANNICVVGDHDQCIYTWRSADLRNLARFEEEFKGTRVIMLEENYRSTKTILTAANDAIKQNAMRKDKTLFTNNTDGAPIEIFTAFNETHEAQWVAKRAKELIAGGISAADIAVLFRAHFQSRALEEAFLSERIPYQMLGTRFFERKEVKDVMSYLNAALNPESMTNFARIVNVPARGIGKTTILRITSGLEHELSASHAAKIANVRALLVRIREVSETLSPSKLIEYIMKESGIETELIADGDEGNERLLNLKELASLAMRYDVLPQGESLHAFMDAVALASDQDAMSKAEASVKLMTVHAAKGLEFKHVFIAGLEEGLFPSERSEMRATPEEREEERRLFYVAITRAKEQAHLSYASVRTVFGSTNVNIPSRFLTDIDEALVTGVDSSGVPIPPRKKDLLTIDWDDL